MYKNPRTCVRGIYLIVTVIDNVHLAHVNTRMTCSNCEPNIKCRINKVSRCLFNREADIEMNTSMNKAKIAHTKYKDVGRYIDEVLSESMTEALDTKQMKFKNGLRIEADNGDVVRINKREHKYVVSGFDKDNNLFRPHTYNSLNGVKNYILRTYNIELV